MARSPLKEGWLFFVYSSITLVNHCKNEVNLRCAFPKLKTTVKSVQTTAEVSRKYYVSTDLSACIY